MGFVWGLGASSAMPGLAHPFSSSLIPCRDTGSSTSASALALPFGVLAACCTAPCADPSSLAGARNRAVSAPCNKSAETDPGLSAPAVYLYLPTRGHEGPCKTLRSRCWGEAMGARGVPCGHSVNPKPPRRTPTLARWCAPVGLAGSRACMCAPSLRDALDTAGVAPAVEAAGRGAGAARPGPGCGVSSARVLSPSKRYSFSCVLMGAAPAPVPPRHPEWPAPAETAPGSQGRPCPHGKPPFHVPPTRLRRAP